MSLHASMDTQLSVVTRYSVKITLQNQEVFYLNIIRRFNKDYRICNIVSKTTFKPSQGVI
jgi:hypothetical protein